MADSSQPLRGPVLRILQAKLETRSGVVRVGGERSLGGGQVEVGEDLGFKLGCLQLPLR
jgi:hypothetical protein